MGGLKGFTTLFFGIVALASTSAQAAVLLDVPNYPGAMATYIRAINDKNVITGYYTSDDGNTHGFVGTLDGNYTSFDASPNGTMPLGIDDAGYITISSNYTADCPVSGCAYIRARMEPCPKSTRAGTCSIPWCRAFSTRTALLETMSSMAGRPM